MNSDILFPYIIFVDANSIPFYTNVTFLEFTRLLIFFFPYLARKTLICAYEGTALANYVGWVGRVFLVLVPKRKQGTRPVDAQNRLPGQFLDTPSLWQGWKI